MNSSSMNSSSENSSSMNSSSMNSKGSVPQANQTLLAEVATKLALSLIGRVSYCGGSICSSCHMQAYSPEVEIHHVPSCLVGQVLEAARASNELEEEFFRVEGRPHMGQV